MKRTSVDMNWERSESNAPFLSLTVSKLFLYVQLYVGISFFETWEGKEEERDFKKGLVGIPLSPPPSLPPGGAKGGTTYSEETEIRTNKLRKRIKP